MSSLNRVIDRLVSEVGLSRTASIRIARKINRLAQSVTWAKPIVGRAYSYASDGPVGGTAQLVKEVAAACGVSNKVARSFVDTYASLAVAETRKNGVFVMPGLGCLVRVERKARAGRNPSTGAAIKVPAKSVVKFKVAKAVKEAIMPAKRK